MNISRDVNGWAKIAITPQLIEKARAAHKERGVINSRTMWRDGGGASFAGILGEVVVSEYLPHFKIESTLQHDGIVKTSKGPKTVDIKTKVIANNPQPFYEQSIFEYTTEFQHPDFYIFVFIESDTPKDKTEASAYGFAHVVGYMPSNWIKTSEKVIFRAAGEAMPGSGTIQRRDNYFIQIKDLLPFKREV